jgi:hypothetical protein
MAPCSDSFFIFIDHGDWEQAALGCDHSREVWLRIDIVDCPKRKKRRPARTHTVFACFAWAALRIMEIKHLTWLQLKKRLVDMPAGCYAPLIFLMYFEKCSMMNSSASGKAKRYTAHKKTFAWKHCMGCFCGLIGKPAFIVGSILRWDDSLTRWRNWPPSHSPCHHVAGIVANNEELNTIGIRFRYWLPVNSLKIYRCRRPLILRIVDVHISLPVLFVVFP